MDFLAVPLARIEHEDKTRCLEYDLRFRCFCLHGIQMCCSCFVSFGFVVAVLPRIAR